MTTEQRSENNTMLVTGNLDLEAPETYLRFADGRIVRVPTTMLCQTLGDEEPQPPVQPENEAIMIPLVEEQLQVGRRVVETGKVHLQKSVESFTTTLDEPLAVETWQVERVSKHEVVEQAPSPRTEGATTIYPILEERLVITKELVLIEEVHVTRIVSERRDTQTVTLRRETLSVEHKSPDQL